MSSELHKLAQTMCSIDLGESHWTQELPRLPVPDLCQTMSRYLASLRAVLAPTTDGASEILLDRRHLKPQSQPELSEENHLQRRQQFEHTERVIRHFMLNEGPRLQHDLKEHANKCQNWTDANLSLEKRTDGSDTLCAAAGQKPMNDGPTKTNGAACSDPLLAAVLQATDYWLQDMYLANPLPLPVNSNPFFMFPRQKFASSEQMLMFATRIIQFAVDFKYRIDQQTLRQDFGSGQGKGKPLCMETYKNFFHSYRMPHEDMDRLLPQSRRSNHIVVVSCDQFYILRLGQDPLDDPYRKDASSQLNESSIFDQLLRIYRVSREHAKRDLVAATSTNKGGRPAIPKVGLFTAENRKIWARVHKKLLHCNGTTAGGQMATNGNGNCHTGSGSCSPNTNTESLRQIEDCLFVMCLDSLVSNSGNNSGTNTNQHRRQSKDELVDGETDVVAANIILTGGGSHLFTANRWFDKFLQIIVGRDGTCGINIEHSASEGITVLRFLEDFLAYIKKNPIQGPDGNNNNTTSNNNNDECKFAYHNQRQHQQASQSDSITSPAYVEPKSPSALLEESDKITPLMWILDDELCADIHEAAVRADKLVNNFSLNILNFTEFGRTFIKNQNLSPDAFIQLALQYSFFKIHGRLVSTYESASLRQFRLGRVDNIRANTCEAFGWIQAMLECKLRAASSGHEPASADWKGAEQSFNRAIVKQVEILRYTIFGTGPDNHLLALKQLAHIRYDVEELPELFTEQSYREFLNFRLSTSQLPNESGITVGYGAVVPDGYGCSYNPCPNRMMFCISTFADCPETSSSKFAEVLSESLLEMQQLCLIRTPLKT